jgi:hypothetical protein
MGVGQSYKDFIKRNNLKCNHNEYSVEENKLIYSSEDLQFENLENTGQREGHQKKQKK